MSQRQRFNPINQVPFSGPNAQPYPLPFNYGAPQKHPLKQNFNHGVPQPHLVPQQFHNQSKNNDRSWIDKALTYRAFTQNQQAPQPNNQQRAPQIQARFANYTIPNQQAQKVPQAHAPYSRAPFGYPPISVNQYYFNYPRGAIKSPQVFNARDQSNQRSSTPNAFRNFQPVSIYHNSVSYGHQIKPSFSPGYNQGFVAQRIPIPPYAKLDVVDSEYFLRQGYTVENLNRLSDVNDFGNKRESEEEVYQNIELPDELKKQIEQHQAELKKIETEVKEIRVIYEAFTAPTNNLDVPKTKVAKSVSWAVSEMKSGNQPVVGEDEPLKSIIRGQ